MVTYLYLPTLLCISDQLAPRQIQSISCNVRNKRRKKTWKQFCSLSPREIPWAPPSGFPSVSGYISPYIPPLVIIQIQYSVSSIRYTVSSIQYPESSIQYLESSIQYPVSSIQYPVSRVSSPGEMLLSWGNLAAGRVKVAITERLGGIQSNCISLAQPSPPPVSYTLFTGLDLLLHLLLLVGLFC